LARGRSVAAHRGIQREAALLPGEHVADIVQLDQPAAGEPAQYPDAQLLGDQGDGLWCQLGDRGKAHGLRDSTGILVRLEDPVGDAAVVVNMALEGGTEAVNEARRLQAGMPASAAVLAQMGLDDVLG
jgi:hypothetical protein